MQSIRDDFNEYNTEAVSVGLKPDQIARFKIHDNHVEAKEKSSRYKAFVKRYGKKVYELEALLPAQLQQVLSEAIDSVINVELFNAELEAEKADAAYLQAVRDRIYKNSFDLLTDNKAEELDGDDGDDEVAF